MSEYLKAEDFERDGIKVKFNTKVRKDQLDSFFYSGMMPVEVTKKGITVKIVAIGEIRVIGNYDKEGCFEVAVNNFEVKDDFADDFANDKSLQKTFDDPKYFWDFNNWFELMIFENGEEVHNFGAVYHEVDSAIIGAMENLEHFIENEEDYHIYSII